MIILTKTKILREYITNQELYDKIIKRYEKIGKNNEKLFFMGIAIQNHGGYTETYDEFFRRIIIKLDVLIRELQPFCPWYTRVMRQ